MKRIKTRILKILVFLNFVFLLPVITTLILAPLMYLLEGRYTFEAFLLSAVFSTFLLIFSIWFFIKPNMKVFLVVIFLSLFFYLVIGLGVIQKNKDIKAVEHYLLEENTSERSLTNMTSQLKDKIQPSTSNSILDFIVSHTKFGLKTHVVNLLVSHPLPENSDKLISRIQLIKALGYDNAEALNFTKTLYRNYMKQPGQTSLKQELLSSLQSQTLNSGIKDAEFVSLDEQYVFSFQIEPEHFIYGHEIQFKDDLFIYPLPSSSNLCEQQFSQIIYSYMIDALKKQKWDIFGPVTYGEDGYLYATAPSYALFRQNKDKSEYSDLLPRNKDRLKKHGWCGYKMRFETYAAAGYLN